MRLHVTRSNVLTTCWSTECATWLRHCAYK